MSGTDNEKKRASRFIEDEIPPLEKEFESAEPKAEAAPESKPESKPESTPAASQTEEFDYVIPQKRKRKKHRKKKRSSEKTSSVNEAMEGYVFNEHAHKGKKHRRHKKRMPTWLKIILIILCVILGIALVLTATFFILRGIGRSAMHNYDGIDIVIPLQNENGENVADVEDKGRTIKYDGKTYKLNEDVMSIVFIGYNENDPSSDGETFMGDAIDIITIDDKTGKTTVLGISRDTMLDVNVYSNEGHFIDTEKKQLAYAYSYSGDGVSGGENVETSLTRLFFGLPFKNYFAIDLAAMKDLNDAIGGVTLTSKMTFDSDYYGRTIEEGEEVTLHGSDVETYVRSRDKSRLDSNNERMDRQQQYIKAFLSSIVPAAKKDLSTVTSLYNVVSDNADSTLDLPKVTYLASTALSKMRSANEVEYLRLNGELKLVGKNAQMTLDDKDVLETMLKVFYTPID